MTKFSNWITGGKSLATMFAVIATIMASSIALDLSANAAETRQAVPDFASYWGRPEPAAAAARFYPPDSGPGPVTFAPDLGEMRRGMPMIGDDTNRILLPHAAAALQAQRAQYATGDIVWSAWALCWPTGVPLAFNMTNAVQFLQSEDQITIVYQRGQTVRRVDLNQAHPQNPEPSWFGHSVGHYEGTSTLVIDTIAQDTRSTIDRFGTPKSDAMRIVERYTISTDRQSLDVEFNVEDPKTFTTAWSATFRYVRLPPGSGDEPQEPIFAEIICPENNRDPQGGGFAIPIAASPSF
jgi:hypothetical protein